MSDNFVKSAATGALPSSVNHSPTIEYYDACPDAHGRRHFALTWTDPNGPYRPEIHPDGLPVGYRRGQHFFSTAWRRYEQWPG